MSSGELKPVTWSPMFITPAQASSIVIPKVIGKISPLTVPDVVGTVILSPLTILSATLVSIVITAATVAPSVKSPLTLSVWVTAGYMSSPSISNGVAPTVAPTKAMTSPTTGCLSIFKDFKDVAVTVNEKGVKPTVAFLEVVITWVPIVPVIVPLGA